VSGGTIAFISGIYEKLVNSIKQLTPYLLIRLKKQGIRSLWKEVDANFLLILFSSMGVSILLFASWVSYLLHNEPIAIWSFFFGLVISSSFIVFREITTFELGTGLAVASGAAIGFVITQLLPLGLAPTPLMLFLGGAIAICAWILPGLSGSFILLILGLYTFVIDAIKSFDIVNLAFVATGAAIGLVCFSQVLSRLFSHRRDETLAVLTGFMLGSLGKLWPWKSTISYQIKADGTQVPVIQEPVMPDLYTHLTGQDAEILSALCFALLGGVLVLALDWV
jgi:putative membrane protein